MNRKQAAVAASVVVILLLIGAYYWNSKRSPEATRDLRFAPVSIDGTVYALKNGVSEVEAAPGSATKIVTRYFGNEAQGDLNGDGIEDTAFLVTQESGGSGTFYYVIAAINSSTGQNFTPAYIIGDRIAPQTTEIKDGTLTVNFADRKEGEPMSAQPSEGKSLRLRIATNSQGAITLAPVQ